MARRITLMCLDCFSSIQYTRTFQLLIHSLFLYPQPTGIKETVTVKTISFSYRRGLPTCIVFFYLRIEKSLLFFQNISRSIVHDFLACYEFYFRTLKWSLYAFVFKQSWRLQFLWSETKGTKIFAFSLDTEEWWPSMSRTRFIFSWGRQSVIQVSLIGYMFRKQKGTRMICPTKETSVHHLLIFEIRRVFGPSLWKLMQRRAIRKRRWCYPRWCPR